MFSYTKNSVNVLTLIISIIFFSILHFFCNIIGGPFLNNKIYKTQVSLNENSNQNNSQIVKTIGDEFKTQRQWINENKNILWRIVIPKINLDVHIKEGTTLEIMLNAVGHFEETSSWNGNVGLAAHNRGNQCNFFENIKNLKIGDEIIYITTKGKKTYKVQTNKTILETDWSYLEPTPDNRITLITCEENRREYRRCVQAVEIASQEIY